LICLAAIIRMFDTSLSDWFSFRIDDHAHKLIA
jgi:hypothetical protein